MNKVLDVLIKSFPLIFVILTAVGYLHLQLFYSFFDIGIINYVELSEIPLLFYNNSISFIGIVLLIMILSYHISVKDKNNHDKLNEQLEKESDSSERIKILNKRKGKLNKSNKRVKRITGFILIILLILMVTVSLLTENYVGLVFPIAYIICSLIYSIIDKAILTNLMENWSLFSKLSVNIGLAAIIIFNIHVLADTIETSYNIKNGNRIIGQIEFSYNKKKVQTNENLKYIGETKNNLFLYDKLKNETIIFKMTNILNLRIKIMD